MFSSVCLENVSSKIKSFSQTLYFNFRFNAFTNYKIIQFNLNTGPTSLKHIQQCMYVDCTNTNMYMPLIWHLECRYATANATVSYSNDALRFILPFPCPRSLRLSLALLLRHSHTLDSYSHSHTNCLSLPFCARTLTSRLSYSSLIFIWRGCCAVVGALKFAIDRMATQAGRKLS